MTKEIPFHITNWEAVPFTRHAGETGSACWKTIKLGDLRIRLVEYSKNYKADHWCSLGHIAYCLEGAFTSELSDGRSFTLSAGTSYQVSNGTSSHRSVSENGATILIIDGNFLNHQKTSVINPWRM